jgi:hypothetical protein
MKHPPEKYANPINGSYEWLHKQAATELKELVGDDNWMLVADAETEGKASQGYKIDWLVMHKTPDGMWVTIPNANGPGSKRWGFDIAPAAAEAAKAKKAAQEAVKAELAKARGAQVKFVAGEGLPGYNIPLDQAAIP